MTVAFKFQDVLLINNVLTDCFGKERLFVWKDTSGRRWAIIKGVLWSMPPSWEESKKPCGNIIPLFNGKPIDCWECKRGVFE